MGMHLLGKRVYSVGRRVKMYADGKEYTIIKRRGDWYTLKTLELDNYGCLTAIKYVGLNQLNSHDGYFFKKSDVDGVNIDECIKACKSSDDDIIFIDNINKDEILWKYNKSYDALTDKNGKKIEALYSLNDILNMKFVEYREKTETELEIEELERKLYVLTTDHFYAGKKLQIED